MASAVSQVRGDDILDQNSSSRGIRSGWILNVFSKQADIFCSWNYI